MKSVFLVLFAFVIVNTGLAQTLDNDSLSLHLDKKKLDEGGLHQYPRLNERKIFEDEAVSTTDFSYDRYSRQHRYDSLKINMDIRVPEYYQGPVSNYLYNPIFPFSNDYDYSGYRGISDRSWMNTRSTHTTYLGLGSSTEISASLSYRLSDNIIVSGGPYISKYMVNHEVYNDIGANAAMQFIVSDKVKFHVFGQYSGFANKHGYDSKNRWGMFPQTSYGGAFEYKITNKFGMMGGMNRELNPMTGKWKNVPFLVPVFYGK